MLMTQYNYTITEHERGLTIVLQHNTDPVKRKTFELSPFYKAAGLDRHMRSLTDELCDGFFPAPRKIKEKKVKDAQPQ